MSQPILKTDQLTIKFGGIVAVDQVSISVDPGIIFGLIGPNGAGKTTMFNLLTGIYKPTEGKVFYKGQDITSLSPHQISAIGISRTFQNIRLLNDHTVFENIMLASHAKLGYKLFDALVYSKKFRSQEGEKKKLVHELLEKYGMSQLKDVDANSLPQGLQRKIEIVRAIATGAELIFLDEPAAGLNPVETDELMDLVKKLKGEGKTITQNKKAYHDYFIEETFEAGIVLQGTEIKSLRAGRVNLKDSYAKILNGEVFLIGMHISPYEQGNRYNHDPERTRKLLLHRKQIDKLIGETKEIGYSIVPLKIYLKNGYAKVLIGLARGKKKYDKREDLKKKEAKRDIERAFRERQKM